MDETGEFRPTFLTNTVMIWGIPLLIYLLLGSPIDWDVPQLKGFNF